GACARLSGVVTRQRFQPWINMNGRGHRNALAGRNQRQPATKSAVQRGGSRNSPVGYISRVAVAIETGQFSEVSEILRTIELAPRYAGPTGKSRVAAVARYA